MKLVVFWPWTVSLAVIVVIPTCKILDCIGYEGKDLEATYKFLSESFYTFWISDVISLFA